MLVFELKHLVLAAGNVPTPWTGIYNASKAALHSLTETLRMEVKGLGINVMLVAPGAITSQFGKKQTVSIRLPEGTPCALGSAALLPYTHSTMPELTSCPSDSLYKDVADKIIERATISQTPGQLLFSACSAGDSPPPVHNFTEACSLRQAAPHLPQHLLRALLHAPFVQSRQVITREAASRSSSGSLSASHAH